VFRVSLFILHFSTRSFIFITQADTRPAIQQPVTYYVTFNGHEGCLLSFFHGFNEFYLTYLSRFCHYLLVLTTTPHGVGLSPLSTAATLWPQIIDDEDCGVVGGMRIDRRTRGTRRKPAPVPLCPPQIPHGLNRARTPATALESRQQTA
jgi:hypothetical protein